MKFIIPIIFITCSNVLIKICWIECTFWKCTFKQKQHLQRHDLWHNINRGVKWLFYNVWQLRGTFSPLNVSYNIWTTTYHPSHIPLYANSDKLRAIFICNKHTIAVVAKLLFRYLHYIKHWYTKHFDCQPPD